MKKILITGPESSGKTTLSKQLAAHFSCPWVAEYAREYLENLSTSYQKEDLDEILLGQLSNEEKAINDVDPLLICDTGPEVFYVWSNTKYGHVSNLIQEKTKVQFYDLRIICYPDLEWENDEWRETPNLEERLKLFEQYRLLHELNKWPYFIAKGQGENRLLPMISLITRTIIS